MPRKRLYGTWYRGIALLAALSLVVPPPTFAQDQPAASAADATVFNAEQLDALLAPIALYPDALLAQVLMATTYPLQVVDASRWLEVPANKALAGDALSRALAGQNWDPSVKSLIPFPQVVAMMNSKLEWMQQVGYAFATQNDDVMNSVQRLRQQAQAAGYLKTTDQQRVTMEKNAVVIEPASPQTVYVPVYNPTVVYGVWPYPAYPPVYIPPHPGYVAANAIVAGVAFATGVAIVGSLWGWARPTWHGGNVNINVNRYNTINVNRPPINSPVWRPPAGGVAGRPIRPPAGPVGTPARPVQLPANAIGRPSVKVPANVINRPGGGAGGPVQGGNAQSPSGGQAGGSVGQRPGGGSNGGIAKRPPGAAQLPAGGGVNRPTMTRQPGQAGGQRPAGGVNRPPAAAQRPAGAFGGISDGARAGQFGARGQQSRATQQRGAANGGARARARSR